MTCTKSYVITASDLNSLGNGSITNLATASGKFGAAAVNSNQAQATVRQQSTTGQLTPTQTTCSDFANGSALNLTQLLYLAKNGSIVSVAEGVLFYYTIIVAPSANFTADIAQTNTKGFPALELQQENKQAQAFLFDSSCVRSSKISNVNVNVNPATKKQTVSFSVSGATPGQIFYLSVKYSVKSLPGTTVSQPLPTVPYSFITNIGGSPVSTSQDSLLLQPKNGAQPEPNNRRTYLPVLSR